MDEQHYWVALALAGPGCSSLGFGAMQELGPFGVKPDGKTLYSRTFSWNKGNQSYLPLLIISHNHYYCLSLPSITIITIVNRYHQSLSLLMTIYHQPQSSFTITIIATYHYHPPHL